LARVRAEKSFVEDMLSALDPSSSSSSSSSSSTPHHHERAWWHRAGRIAQAGPSLRQCFLPHRALIYARVCRELLNEYHSSGGFTAEDTGSAGAGGIQVYI
jgi:hypothetical protein